MDNRKDIMESFYNIFNPNRIKVTTPGRDWDDNGLASWYEEEVYPTIDGEVFLSMLAEYNKFIQEHRSLNFLTRLLPIETTEFEIIKKFCSLLIKSYNNIEDKELKKEFKETIKATIDEYYKDWEEE